MQISLLGNNTVALGPGIIEKTSASARNTAPWNVRRLLCRRRRRGPAHELRQGNTAKGIGGAGDREGKEEEWREPEREMHARRLCAQLWRPSHLALVPEKMWRLGFPQFFSQVVGERDN